MFESLPDYVNLVISIVVMTLVIVVIYFIITKIIKYNLSKFNQDSKMYGRKVTTSKLLLSAIKYITGLVFIVGVLLLVGVNLATIMTSAGLLSIAIGFGAKSLVEDFIAGFFIYFEQQYDVGDTVEIDDFKGEVISLGFKSTMLKDWLGNIFIIGNGKIMSVVNFSQTDSVSVVKTRISTETDLSELETILNSELKSVLVDYSLFVESPVYKGVTDFKSSGVEILVVANTLPMRNIEGERIIRKVLFEILKKHNIELAKPKIEVVSDLHV